MVRESVDRLILDPQFPEPGDVTLDCLRAS